MAGGAEKAPADSVRKKADPVVKIRVFIPHLELKEIFENVVDELPSYDNVQIETPISSGLPMCFPRTGMRISWWPVG